MKKVMRTSALLAAGVWSVALLIFLFPPPPIVTQAPPVKQIIGVQDYLMCPGLVSPGSYSAAPEGVALRVNSSASPGSGFWPLGTFCVAPGGWVSIQNTGRISLFANEYTGYGGPEASPTIAPGQQIIVLPTHSGYITLATGSTASGTIYGIISIVIAQPVALPPGVYPQIY